MAHDSNIDDDQRRRFLKLAAAGGLVGTAGLAGCAGQSSDDQETQTESPFPLEVMHGWTGGDGKEAITALTDGFKEKYPDMDTMFKPIGGVANVGLNTLINQRFANQDPPSSFAAWPGKHLSQYTADDLLGDITDSVWSHNDMESGFLEEAKELSKSDGAYVAVPIGSHRLNNLFYNVSVLEDAGVDPSSISSPEKLVSALEAVDQNTDAAGMAQAMTGANTVLQLWGATFLGNQGYQPYMDLINGDGDVDAVKESLELVKQYAQYFNEDADSTSPPGANEKIMNGEAAFLHQGNWMAGGYRANDLTYNEDWGWIAFPGTSNMYTLHFDAFVYPGDNPSPQKSAKWLRYVGSKEAQIEFNKRKGSIPARTDVSKDEFGPYLQETIEDFASVDHKPPTIAHGLAVSPDKLVECRKVLNNNFMGPYNVDAAAEGLIDALSA
jgi:glucose/mannose transport system substrate-binding protein